MRSYLLYAAIGFVLIYSTAILWHVRNRQVLGIHCLLRDANATGPKFAVDDEIDFVGDRPENGDRLLETAGKATPTFVHFNRRLYDVSQRNLSFAIPELSHPAELLRRPELPATVDLAGERWVRIRFLRDDRSATPTEHEAWLRLLSIPRSVLGIALAWFLLELLILGIGALVAVKRPGDPSAAMFCALCTVHVVTFMGAFHWPSLVDSRLLIYPFLLCTLLIAPLMVHFYLLFPRPVAAMRRRPGWSLAALYAVPAAWVVLMFTCLFRLTWLYETAAPPGELTAQLDLFTRLMYVYIPLSLTLFVLGQGILIHSFVHSRTVAERNQVKWLLGAMLLAAWPVCDLLYTSTYQPAEFVFGLRSKGMMYLTSILFALGYAFSITRYKLTQVAWMLNRGLWYVAISFAATVVFCLLVGLGTALVGSYYIPWENAAAAGATAMLVVVLLGWVRDRFQRALDRRFHQDKYQLDKAMRRLSEAVDQLIEPAQLARQLLQSARDAVRAERGAVYLRDDSLKHFELAARTNWPSIEDRLPADSPLVRELSGAGLVARDQFAVSHATAAQRQLRTWDAALCLPLELDGAAVGLIVLGAKQDATPYSTDDRAFLTALAQTTALALASARGHRTIETLRQELQDKVRKIAEQQQRIMLLQTELLNRTEVAEQPAGPGQLAARTSTTNVLEPGKHEIHGSSPAVRELLAEAVKVAGSNSSVLIRGESGTGKELLAEAIHRHSPRAAGPFVQVHCAALSPGLLESELFGHVRGAFTGADRDKAGRFELAHGGTLFLDEIGDISLETQTKLLRVLQRRSFERVGGVKTIEVDVRLVAATHQNLEELILQGRFREDLYYRLNVISLRCPALRERREDIFPLALHFMRRFAGQAGKPLSRIDDDAVEALMAHAWPGNIRQLENALERAVVLAEGATIRRGDLPPEIVLSPSTSPARQSALTTPSRGRRSPAGFVADVPVAPTSDLEAELLSIERKRLLEAIAQAQGNKALAARVLGMPRSTLSSKLRKLGLE